METHEGEQFVTFPLADVHDAIQENMISHEEICEPSVDECVLQEDLTDVPVNDVNAEIAEPQNEILAEQSDEEDDNQVVYPMYIKQEEQQQYTSGDDESMAVEALRQLGGMYPCFEDKKVSCPTCKNLFNQDELAKHQSTCTVSKLSCTTCGERFERKIDLNNHMVCHQVDRPHACRTCGNLFRSKSSLQSHMQQVHQVERPHKCTVCGSDFQRPSSLSNHMKIHTYIAGRAIQQSGNLPVQETFRKWPEDASDSQNTSQVSSVHSIQNYDVCQVQWPVSSYNFQGEQSTVTTMSNQQEKMDALQEFTVMSNGEVTQFEYTEQNSIGNAVGGQQYNLSLNSFDGQDGVVKVEALSYNNENRRNFVEIEENGGKQQQQQPQHYTCKHCGVAFSRATALASHEKIHTAKNWNMPIECEYCDKQFQDGNHLATHQTTCAKKIMRNNMEQGVSNNKWSKHACSECGKKFTTKQKMFRHQWIHRKKTHSCEVCGVLFEKQSELDEHRLSAHLRDAPHTCSECGKSFVSRQGLWEHGRTHVGSPAHFQCDKCLKTFSSRQGYLIHNRTHTGERPYGCKYCWKSFRDGGTLRKHERIHTGERPHVCPLCSRAFNQKVVLREHVRWVHAAGKNETEASDPPYQCSLCGALNQDRDELCAHIVKHSDQLIAEAKAKNNDGYPKSKSLAKKKAKSKSSSSSSSTSSCGINAPSGKHDALEHFISKTEQNEALLSITENVDKPDDLHVINDKPNNAFVVVTAEKRTDGFIAISEFKHSNIRFIVDGKEDENIHVLHVDQNHRDPLDVIAASEECSDATQSVVAADETIRRGEMTTMHLIQASPGKQNTLNIISKQNESLPVLAIPNPQSHTDYSSQIVQVSDADLTMVGHQTQHLKDGKSRVDQDEQDRLMQEEASQTAVIQVVQYQQQESDEDEEFTCGICGEEFDEKSALKEHIKIHI
ncbi:PREDICTED: zinc finger and SCAN domain-containing protein 2-like [Dinoponera quadriceps]|uniref:Zinc finger and SCAN domain-containing protein 2-like n=1 Tax=Dinoponera quadriceps TaxID=609295 RepID=A0A6P3WNR8_DINQU|nr:PREDICTED: zinc finger and SCAN domain-containing protein 2-like [Dinoponera quadriceps]